jgi:putative membrane protein
MKNLDQLKTVLLQVSLIAATLSGVASCNNSMPKDSKKDGTSDTTAFNGNQTNSNNTVNGTDDMNDINNTNGTNNPNSNRNNNSDAEFMMKVAEINMGEIQFGQLAQKMGSTTDIKDLGKMMEKAHKKASKDLATLAKKKSVMLPTALNDKVKEDYVGLSNRSDNDFDKQYSDMMVKGHQDAIALFEKTSKESSDADVKQFANATLPDLRMHLESAMACKMKADKMDNGNGRK